MQIEEEIFSKLNSKDETEKNLAFDKLYNKYYRLVFFIVSKYLTNNEDKEDLVQTIFLKIFQSTSKIKDYRFISYYISSVAKNESINFLKKEKKEIPFQQNMASSSYNIIYVPELNNCLNKEDANIVILKIYYGYTFKDIEEMLNIPLKTIASRYYKALETLKNYYGEQ